MSWNHNLSMCPCPAQCALAETPTRKWNLSSHPWIWEGLWLDFLDIMQQKWHGDRSKLKLQEVLLTPIALLYPPWPLCKQALARLLDNERTHRIEMSCPNWGHVCSFTPTLEAAAIWRSLTKTLGDRNHPAGPGSDYQPAELWAQLKFIVLEWFVKWH